MKSVFQFSTRSLKPRLQPVLVAFLMFGLVAFLSSSTTITEQSLENDVDEYVVEKEIDKSLSKVLRYLEDNSFKINDQQEIIWATLLNEAFDLRLNIPSGESLRKGYLESKYWQHKIYGTYFNPTLQVLDGKMINRFRRNPEMVFSKQPESTRIYSLYCDKLNVGESEFLAALQDELERGVYAELNVADPIMMLQNVIDSKCLVDSGEEEKQMLKTLVTPLSNGFDLEVFLNPEPVDTKSKLLPICLLLYTDNCDLLNSMIIPYLLSMQMDNGGFAGNTGESVDSYFQSLIGAWALLEIKNRIACFDEIKDDEDHELAMRIHNKLYYSYQEFDSLRSQDSTSSEFVDFLKKLGMTEKQYQDSIANIPKGQIFEEGSYRPAW